MKVLSVVRILLCLMGLFLLGEAEAYAQSEIDPDHFDSPNTEPFTQPKHDGGSQVVETRFEGKFTLPYSVQRTGKRLLPGEYSVSLRSNGKIGQAILNLKDQAIGIAGIVLWQAANRSNSALIVESKGKVRTLSSNHVAQFDFIFDPNHQVESSPKSKPKRFEKLPLILLALKKAHGTAG